MAQHEAVRYQDIRLVQILVGEPAGGAERFFVKLAIALQNRGIPQKIVIRRDRQRALELREGGCDVSELDFGNGWRDFMARMQLRRIVGSFHPDVVMAWMNRAARRMPRGNFAKVARLGGYYPLRFYRKCDWLVANTPDLVRHIREGGWPADRVAMISNFGELTSAAAVSRSVFDTPDDAPLFLSMGRLHPDKGFDVLLKALAQIPAAYLWIAGTGGIEADLRSLADELGIADRVRFLGWRNDQAALFQACDLCVVPSRHEPLSNVTVEAWSLGVPVVATASEGPSWLVDDGINGLLSPVDDAEALAASIGRAVTDQDLRQRIAEGGRKKWAANFSEDAICNQYFDFFARIIASSGHAENGTH